MHPENSKFPRELKKKKGCEYFNICTHVNLIGTHTHEREKLGIPLLFKFAIPSHFSKPIATHRDG